MKKTVLGIAGLTAVAALLTGCGGKAEDKVLTCSKTEEYFGAAATTEYKITFDENDMAKHLRIEKNEDLAGSRQYYETDEEYEEGLAFTVDNACAEYEGYTSCKATRDGAKITIIVENEITEQKDEYKLENVKKTYEEQELTCK